MVAANRSSRSNIQWSLTANTCGGSFQRTLCPEGSSSSGFTIVTFSTSGSCNVSLVGSPIDARTAFYLHLTSGTMFWWYNASALIEFLLACSYHLFSPNSQIHQKFCPNLLHNPGLLLSSPGPKITSSSPGSYSGLISLDAIVVYRKLHLGTQGVLCHQ